MIKRTLIALAAVFLTGLVTPASAQCNTQSFPANSVAGRLGIGPGPCQTVPFATLVSKLNISSNTNVGDTNYQILPTDRVVSTSAAFTATRTWTLPLASTVGPGQNLQVNDLFGGISSANALIIAPSGADTINGGTSVSMSIANGQFALYSDGISKWSAQLTPGSGSGTDQNILRLVTVNDTVLTSDCGKRLRLGTGSSGLFTETLPSVAGFNGACRVSILNGDNSRGKKLAGFPADAPAILWPNQEIDVAIVNGAWVTVQKPGRFRLGIAITLNVDPVNGSDTNDGLATGAGNALLTRQKAWDLAADNFDLAGQVLTTQYADGTYTDNFLTFKAMVGAIGPASVIIQGNAGTPANVVVSTTSASAFSFGVNVGGNEQGAVVVAYIKNMRLKTTTSGHGIEVAGSGTNILWDNIDFNTIAGYDIDLGFQAYSANAGAVTVPGAPGTFTISGNATGFALVAEGAQLTTHGATLTCSGNPAFTTFINESWGARVFAAAMTFTSCGGVTGQRFNITSNSILHTLGSLTYLPGSTAGVVGSGGMYLGSTAQEGAWTPTLIGSTSGNWTLSTAVGSFEINGRLATVRFNAVASAANSPVGNFQIGGLPFAAANVANDNGACALYLQGGLTNSASYTTFTGFITPNTSAITIAESGSGQVSQIATVAKANTTPVLEGTCNYRIF